MRLIAAAHSIKGRRNNNEDAIAARPELGFFAVADGMGGYEGGEIASQLAISTLARMVGRALGGTDVYFPEPIDLNLSPTENLLRIGAIFAHERILHQRTGRLAEMGSTLAMLAVVDRAAVIAHVGDSRIYRLREGLVEQLTTDHSLYEELRASGADLPPKAKFPHAHVITRALGIRQGTLRPDLKSEPVQRGDTFLLCTDGLSEHFEAEELGTWLEDPDLERACHALIDEAYRRGSRDNISAILVRAVG
ncbi:MAG: protein phosphatase 2C domain-containing protein [Myxococcota bacterium]